MDLNKTISFKRTVISFHDMTLLYFGCFPDHLTFSWKYMFHCSSAEVIITNMFICDRFDENIC